MNTNNAVENIADGVKRQWILDGDVVLYTMTDSSKDNVDAYIESNIQMVREWPRPKPFLNVQDISSGEVLLTPYFRTRLQEVEAVLKEYKQDGFSAIILPDTFMFRIFSMFGRFFTQRVGTGLEQRYFTDTDKGIEWITEKRNELVEAPTA